MLSKILRYKEQRLIMSFKIYFILFMLYSIFGWICEEIVTFDPKKGFINRGFLLGPYCPIYGFSAIFMTILLNKFSNSLAIFSLALIICSTVEYLSSYVMEKLFNARWSDYSKKPFNINGRICLKNALCFGVMGLILIKVVDPYLRTLILRFSPLKINIAFYVMLITFTLDNILSYKLIFKIKSENTFKKRDNTREISQKGKEILSKSLLGNKFVIIFPEKLKEGKEKIIKQKEKIKKKQEKFKNEIKIEKNKLKEKVKDEKRKSKGKK